MGKSLKHLFVCVLLTLWVIVLSMADSDFCGWSLCLFVLACIAPLVAVLYIIEQ